MKFLRLSLALGALLAMLGVAGLAAAHANLVRTVPPANAVLAESPDEIQLYYSEPLEPAFSQATLRDADGNPLEIPPAEIVGEGGTALVLHPGDLPDGVYAVAWRVISTADGHLTQGTFSFTIGEAAQGSAAPAAISEPIPVDSALVRWLNVLSLALAVGSVSFFLLVWQPAMPEWRVEIEPRLRRLMWIGWAAVGVTTGLVLLLQVSIVGNVELFASLASPALGPVIADTRFGQLWLVRVGVWLGLGAALWAAGRGHRRGYWIALPAGVLLLLGQSLFSHASSAQDAAASVAGDWLHLLAIAAWIGGLVQFLNVIPPVRARSGALTLAILVGHFSNFARVAVAVVLLTGLYAAWLLVGSVEGLLTTVYGQTLLIKIALVIPLLGLGAINLLLTRRALKAGSALWGGRLRRLVGAEVVFGVLIMAAVGVLTAIAPARNIVALRAAVPVPPKPFFDSYYVEESQIHVDLEISPGWVGENEFKVTVYTHAGDPITDASLIRMRFQPLAEDLGESELRPTQQEDGTYVVSGTNLSLPGAWRIRVMMQRPGEYDTVVDFTPQIEAEPAPVIPAVNMTPTPGMRALWLLLSGVGLLLFGGLAISAGGLRRGRSRLAALPLALVSAAFVVSGVETAWQVPADQTPQAASAVTPDARQETTLPNPIAPDAASISAGNALYAQYCVPCHGAGGKGDGPVGLTLNPRPADLTVHTVSGVHTDGQLFEWISGGFPGSAMPAFGQSLSETDRWNLVNYIRTLGQTP